MALHIFNSLTRQKSEFIPLKENVVNLYVCGMTVYDYCHIGHARLMLVFDMVTRYLRFRGYHVNYIQNITDIDDKIIQRAIDNNESCKAVTERNIQALIEDLNKLQVIFPDQQPRATEYVAQMIKMITTLLEKGYAYVASNGDVMYSVHRFEGYGKLSNRKLEDLRAGSRIEINAAKEDPLDFVLWKMAKPGEPSWTSPWGEGRPGWHIECSTMVMETLGKRIDIHGGGMDLKFPHHENEIAQSEACTGETLANTWMHVGFLQVDNEKMSKSLGNFFLLRDALKKFSPEQIRFFMLASHYRRPINYSAENLNNAQEGLGRLYTAIRGITYLPAPEGSNDEKDFCQAMNDDFNTPEAMAVLFNLAKSINKAVDEKDLTSAGSKASLLKKLAGIFGLLNEDPEDFFQKNHGVDAQKINALIQERAVAREQKNWPRADAIRQELEQLGVVLEDINGKTTWRIKF